MADFSSSEIRTRAADGTAVVLRANEPRPDLTVAPLPTRLLDPGGLGMAGLRLQVEAVLDRGCGEEALPRLMRLGPDVATILLKIAAVANEDYGCRCGRRLGAIAALGRFPRADSADLLRRLVADRAEDVAVRAGAAISLGRAGSVSAVAELGRILRADPDPVMRRAAARGLAHTRSLDALGALEAAAAGDRDARVKLQAYAALRGLEKLHGRRLSAVKAPPPPKRSAPVRLAPPGTRPPTSPGRSLRKARKR
jgi:HEAT repeats